MKACIFFLIATLGMVQSSYAADSPYFRLKSMQDLKFKDIERQTTDYSCGAASIAILLSNYFGDAYGEMTLLSDIVMRLPQEEMAVRLKEGFSLLDLKQLVMRLGYTAEGVKLPLGAAEALDGPIIVLLKKGTFKHFVLLKGAKNGRAYIADPVQGHIRMPMWELGSQWDGEALVVERKGFGLPMTHGLNLPADQQSLPEEDAVRVLQHTPLKQRSML